MTTNEQMACFGTSTDSLKRLAESTPAYQRPFVVMGLMSDAQEMIACSAPDEARKFLNRAKFLTAEWYAVHPAEHLLVKVPAAVVKTIDRALEHEARDLRSQTACAFANDQQDAVALLDERLEAVEEVLTQVRPRGNKAAA
jgi:hypothetical protein